MEGAFSGKGILLGIALGLAWYFLRKKNAAQNESAGTIDGKKVEAQVVEESVHYHYMDSEC